MPDILYMVVYGPKLVLYFISMFVLINLLSLKQKWYFPEDSSHRQSSRHWKTMQKIGHMGIAGARFWPSNPLSFGSRVLGAFQIRIIFTHSRMWSCDVQIDQVIRATENKNTLRWRGVEPRSKPSPHKVMGRLDDNRYTINASKNNCLLQQESFSINIDL